MSELTWLPRGLEQDAPPISQPLPETRELTYRVGGNRHIRDASDAAFDPHFWLFILATAKWRAGYDDSQRSVYTISLLQYQVFHVLLVDYWKPPVEEWRQNQPIEYTKHGIVGTEAGVSASTFTPDASPSVTLTSEPAPIVPTWSAG